jgi:hypothetical protein
MIAGARAKIWVRLDRPGNNACRFAETGDDLLIEGSLMAEGEETMHYRIRATRSGATQRARIDVGDQMHVIERGDDKVWTLNGVAADIAPTVRDIDLGLTPATKTLMIRRLDLGVGDAAELTSAWLDPSDWQLKPLRQTYRRTGETTYDYSAPDYDYAGEFVVDDYGIVLTFPGLWQAQD